MSDYFRPHIDYQKAQPLVDMQEINHLTLDDYSFEEIEKKFPKLHEELAVYEKYGTDCFSFTFHLLQKMGMRHRIFENQAVQHFTSFPQSIQREHFESQMDFKVAVENHILQPSEEIDKEGKLVYREFWRQFTKNFLEMSKKQGLNTVSSARMHSDQFSDHALEEGLKSDEEVLADLSQTLKLYSHFPQVLFIALDNQDGTLRDLHASTIIGPIADSDDFWTLERRETGDPAQLRPLSRVIEDYNKFGLHLRRAQPEAKINFCLVKSEQAVLDTV